MSTTASNDSSKPKAFDLTRMQLVEALFLDCTIRHESASTQSDNNSFQIDRLVLTPDFDMTEQRVSYTLELHINGMTEEGNLSGLRGEFRLYFKFAIDGIQEYSMTNASRKEPFPATDLMIMLGGVAYSTTRGMLFGKTAGTPLSGFALPLRNPKELFFESIKLLEAEAKAVTKKRAPAKRKPKTE
jgi:hypothetical protein